MQAQCQRFLICPRFSLAMPGLLALATAIAAFLCLDSPAALAQTKPATALGQTVVRPATPERTVGTATTAQAGAANNAERSGGSGMHEGIKVHGHWMIEVRNPDGKLLSHTEFENKLVDNAGGGGGFLPFFLAQNGNSQINGFTPGEWGILLGDPSSPPCSAGLSPSPFNQSNGFFAFFPPLAGPYCVITQLANGAVYPTNCGSNGFGCSFGLGLQYVPSTSTLPPGGLLLTGSVVSQSAGTISQVQTLLSACGPSVAPSVCWSETSPDSLVLDSLLAFTEATLPASNTTTTPCGGTGQISCAVPVPAAGDTINVSVAISFQ